jgi:hypothetical protein
VARVRAHACGKGTRGGQVYKKLALRKSRLFILVLRVYSDRQLAG